MVASWLQLQHRANFVESSVTSIDILRGVCELRSSEARDFGDSGLFFFFFSVVSIAEAASTCPRLLYDQLLMSSARSLLSFSSAFPVSRAALLEISDSRWDKIASASESSIPSCCCCSCSARTLRITDLTCSLRSSRSASIKLSKPLGHSEVDFSMTRRAEMMLQISIRAIS